ncbi:MAG TPA: DUF4382 domain-containing protein [Thermodesulfobacteriota bacterium]
MGRPLRARRGRRARDGRRGADRRRRLVHALPPLLIRPSRAPVRPPDRRGAALALAAALAGCGAGEEQGTGTFGLRMGDAPIEGAERVVVTFDRVELVGAPGRVTVWEGRRSVDLLEFRNCELFDLVPPTSVPAGVYEQVRLHIVGPSGRDPMPNYVEFAGGRREALEVPSGGQSGARIPGPFVVPAGGSLGVLADFDLGKSIHLVETGSGKYLLRPVLRAVEDVRAAAVRGTVTAVGGEPLALEDAPVVYAWQGTGPLVDPATRIVAAEKVVASAAPRVDGSYCLGPLGAGTYQVTALAGVHRAPVGDTLVDQWDGRFTQETWPVPLALESGEEATGVDFSLSPIP